MKLQELKKKRVDWTMKPTTIKLLKEISKKTGYSQSFLVEEAITARYQNKIQVLKREQLELAKRMNEISEELSRLGSKREWKLGDDDE